MRRILTLALCLLPGFCGIAAHASGEIAAEPSAITAGQSSTLKWYFNGAKITVSGGSFAPGTPITGKQILTVKPKKTTKYLFDVYYHPELPADKQATGTGKLTHVQYTVTVEVLGPMPGLLAYKGTHNWRVNYQTGWKPMTNEGAGDDLVWFQAEEDAVDRLSVAIVPLKDKTAAQLMEEIRADIPSHYTHAQVVSQNDATQQSLPGSCGDVYGQRSGASQHAHESLHKSVRKRGAGLCGQRADKRGTIQRATPPAGKHGEQFRPYRQNYSDHSQSEQRQRIPGSRAAEQQDHAYYETVGFYLTPPPLLAAQRARRGAIVYKAEQNNSGVLAIGKEQRRYQAHYALMNLNCNR